MRNPYLSIVIPVYNTEKYLRKCIDSVVSQTFSDREIILVNDGSTDQSQQICEEYCQKYDYIKLINQKNGGASLARNAGLQAAGGKYIHFIDSDDFILSPLVHEKLFQQLSDKQPDIIFCLYKDYDVSTTTEIGKQEPYHLSGDYDSDILLHVLKEQYSMTLTCPVNKIFNRSFLIENNLFFEPGLDHEEDEWLPRVIASAKVAYFYNEYIYGVRNGRVGSLSNIPGEETIARKARSKMKIASTGIEYMKQKDLNSLTLQYVAGYYWEYMMAALINTQRLKDRKLKKTNYQYIKSRNDFFKNYRLLLNRNWKMVGWLSLHFGIRFAAVLLSWRYS